MTDRPGTCRVCGCTDYRACFVGHPSRTCAWANGERTLCSNPACINRDMLRNAEAKPPQ